jgi:hypothetical protein
VPTVKRVMLRVLEDAGRDPRAAHDDVTRPLPLGFHSAEYVHALVARVEDAYARPPLITRPFRAQMCEPPVAVLSTVRHPPRYPCLSFSD